SKDTLHLIPILKEILAINPEIKLMASPWSAPVWMKTNASSKGGNLKPEFYAAYAQYFVKYIQAMQAQGILIDAVTVQNEPQHGGNNPSMVMSSAEQADFVKNHLGLAFQAAGISTKIIVWDHNCDNPGYPIAILDDPAAKAFVHGSAFHLYAGDASAMSQVHAAHPDKALYFTEQWTGSTSDFGGDLQWHVKNVIIGTMRNWSQTALEWNLANDPNFEPHTPGGCTECKGALTISGTSVASRNVSYYIIAHASKFVPAGSVRVGSNLLAQMPNVAFVTPEGKRVLIAVNEAAQPASFNIHAGGKWIVATLQAGAVGTFVW
ncbi:MAG: glycoside hydrolase family 30 beta sandwich domain-containing protein, partial [Bacteroidota bacterium]